MIVFTAFPGGIWSQSADIHDPRGHMSETTIEISQFQQHEKDTGSSSVQIARLTSRINHLTDHLGTHRKDISSRRGLLKLVAQRRKLLDYLKRTDNERYQGLLKALKLRR